MTAKTVSSGRPGKVGTGSSGIGRSRSSISSSDFVNDGGCGIPFKYLHVIRRGKVHLVTLKEFDDIDEIPGVAMLVAVA